MLYPGYALTLTGHSLGAGTAELLTMDFLEGEASKLLPAGTKVHCVALAPPPVFRPGGGQGLSTRVVDAIEIYINNCDIVPRLSLASIAHLLACLRAVDELKLSLGTQFDILIGEPGPQFPKVVEAVQGARQDSFAYLEHPGRIYYLKRNSTKEKLRTVFRQESSSFSEKIFLLDNMVLDHIQPSYEEALNNILMSSTEEEDQSGDSAVSPVQTS